MRLGFRAVDGFAERLVYREMFPRGLSALDTFVSVAFEYRTGAAEQGSTTILEEWSNLMARNGMPDVVIVSGARTPMAEWICWTWFFTKAPHTNFCRGMVTELSRIRRPIPWITLMRRPLPT